MQSWPLFPVTLPASTARGSMRPLARSRWLCGEPAPTAACGVPPQPLSAVTVPVTDCPGIVLRERRAVRLVARRRLGRLAARDPRRRRVRPPATHRPPRSTPSHLHTHRHTHPPARSAHHTPSTPRPAPSHPCLCARPSRSSLQRASYSPDDAALVYLSFHNPAISGNAAQLYHGPPPPYPSSHPSPLLTHGGLGPGP